MLFLETCLESEQQTKTVILVKLLQMFNREYEVKHLFAGTNCLQDLCPPVVFLAPIGSGKSTILKLGVARQPHTIICTVRAGEKSGVPMGEADFVHSFAKSIGLLEPPQLLKLVSSVLDGVFMCNAC